MKGKNRIMDTKAPKTKVDELKDALKKKAEAESARAKVAAKDEIEKTEESANKNNAGDGGAIEKDKDADDLSRQIQAAEEDAKLHYDKLLRMMAEFENYKKRVGKEKEEQFKFANENLITELLPSLDDLDRVLEHVPENAAEEIRAIADGVGLVRKTLSNVLAKFGLREVEAADQKFDPNMHEAIAMVESDVHEPDMVMAVHRKGYWLHERLLRAAMVTVAKEKTGETIH